MSGTAHDGGNCWVTGTDGDCGTPTSADSASRLVEEMSPGCEIALLLLMVFALKVARQGTMMWRLSRFWQVSFSSGAIRPCHWRVNNSAIHVVRPCYWRVNSSAFQQWQGRGASELKKICPNLQSQNIQNTKSFRLLLFFVVVLCCFFSLVNKRGHGMILQRTNPPETWAEFFTYIYTHIYISSS